MSRQDTLRRAMRSCILLATSAPLVLGVGCWAGPASSGKKLQVDLKGCEGVSTGRIHEPRNENCCSDFKWGYVGPTGTDSVGAFRVGIGKDPQTAEVQSVTPNDAIVLRLVTEEDSLLI